MTRAVSLILTVGILLPASGVQAQGNMLDFAHIAPVRNAERMDEEAVKSAAIIDTIVNIIACILGRIDEYFLDIVRGDDNRLTDEFETALKSYMRTFWDKVREVMIDHTDEVAGYPENQPLFAKPRLAVFLKDLYSRVICHAEMQQSTFMRHEKQYRQFSELAEEYIKKHGRYPSVAAFGPGLYQEPITLILAMEAIGRRYGLGEVQKDDIAVIASYHDDISRELIKRVRTDQIAYDPADVARLPAEWAEGNFERRVEGFKPTKRIRELICSDGYVDVRFFRVDEFRGARRPDFIFLMTCYLISVPTISRG